MALVAGGGGVPETPPMPARSLKRALTDEELPSSDSSASKRVRFSMNDEVEDVATSDEIPAGLTPDVSSPDDMEIDS